MGNRTVHGTADHRRGAVAPRRTARLGRTEALRLLGTVSLGRIVFTQRALPAVRPVNHLMDGEDVVVRLHDGATLASLVAPADTAGVVVAYEADAIDPETHIGWSVVVTGYAHRVTDEGELARFTARLRPWAEHPAVNAALRIRPDLVTGLRLTG
ncbi:pyridoxamine 5'-phosphate oxidase family protein [Streptomyces somaliensis DSM 40738]|uniref:Pyridoxamine 5'-phosphate oxidase family protein n=1 Tax=Streptomyces somaliensis (strain ATCC 33201 / DSM 40738 / JCM 12659 / KCTC 9044 / NCTC 11332 / NRRL B-12077 / IP 733) TaxID=1134445 RepID=A0AA44DFA1_STRE0|nr:pyridoxamine 5'-phosphate oxidase family protein [Streptomyces somaliensis]MCQ0021676.1 pyridoxamine 5'-phosphate oxidase family protein [Streptomyces somaliensis DSM 40738]NKY15901.1 pyridoxamine 5'-phosphate oxidase family protein [Streptomyces somaliensis DSM 40738]